MANFAREAKIIARAQRAMPFDQQLLLKDFTVRDLRESADDIERQVKKRRALADHMEANGIYSMTTQECIAWTKGFRCQ